MDDCIFCKIVKGEIPSFKVYEDDRVYAFADINPISDGHTLIIPKSHAENLGDIAEDDLMAIHRVSQKMFHAMRSALGADGVALMQANGKSVNQVVMHYHLHLIPRLEGAPELKMTEWELKPGDMDAIRETGDKISAAIR